MSIKRLNMFGAAVRNKRLLRLIDYTERHRERDGKRHRKRYIVSRIESHIESHIKGHIKGHRIWLCTAVLFLLFFAESCGGRTSAPVLETCPVSETAENESSTDSDVDLSEDLLIVHVCGAVRKEGVYKLPRGSRICDAVEAAGGFAADADTSWLNLAAVAEDASQIRIPTVEETEAVRENPDFARAGSSFPAIPGQKLTGGEPFSGRDDRIDLNTASREELMTLPGIGEAKAGQIIAYREKNGRFETIEDIMKVPGIKDAGFEKLKEYITVR